MGSQRTHHLARLALFLALTLVIQLTGLPQPVLGPLVNGMLLLASLINGPLSALFLGVLTPVVALIRGHLPPFLTVLVPFIAAANGILITTFVVMSKILPDRSGRMFSLQNVISVFLAAIFKSAFLFLAIRVLVPLWLGIEIPPKIAFMMTTPQFLTAITGGLIALFLIHLLRKRGIR